MSSFSRGMEKGAAAFGDFADRQVKEIRKANDKLDKNIDECKELIRDVIDLIELPEEQRTDFIKVLQEKVKNKTLKHYSINVYYEDKSEGYAKDLAQTLNNLGHSTSIVNYAKSRRSSTMPTDYSIYIENLNDRALNKSDIIYNMYGITISELNGVIVAQFDRNILLSSDGEAIGFCAYYENTVGKLIEVNKENRKMSKKATRAKK